MVKILEIDFNTTNPLGFEWACLLTKAGKDVEYINKNKFKFSILFKFKFKKLNLERFNIAKASKSNKVVLFLPWLPPKQEILKLFFIILRFRVRKIFWIDHNPVPNRNKRGIVIKFLRKTRNSFFVRLIHTGVKDQFSSVKVQNLVHPIFFNYVSSKVILKKEFNQIPNIIFFGRICYQKGADLLPNFLINLDNYLRSKNIFIKFTVIGQISNTEIEILNQLNNLRLKFIELYLKIDSNVIPESELIAELVQANLVFAPYRNITESGTSSLAIALSKPIFFVGKVIPASLTDSIFNKLVFSFNLEDNFIPFLVEILNKKPKKLNKAQVASLEANYLNSFENLLDI